jgi:hypothetical protein
MKKTSTLTWIIVSLAGFILFTVFFYLLIVYSKDISLSTPLYFFLVVLIALMSTAFLAGAMRSVARYSSSSQGGSLYLSGPAVIFFVIIYLGYRYRPEPSSDKSPLSLSVLLKGPEGSEELIRSGQVRVRIGQYSGVKQVNNEGAALFTGISPENKGRKIDLSAEIPGYHLINSSSYSLDDSMTFTNLTLRLHKKLDSVAVRGNVIRLPGRTGIPGAIIRFQGVMQTYKTDSLGDFSAMLPFPSGAETRIIVSKGNKEIYNSLRTLSENDFLSISAN